MPEPRPDVAALVEKAAEAYLYVSSVHKSVVRDSRAALTALTERIAELERERDEALHAEDVAERYREAAEARLAELERINEDVQGET